MVVLGLTSFYGIGKVYVIQPFPLPYNDERWFDGQATGTIS